MYSTATLGQAASAVTCTIANFSSSTSHCSRTTSVGEVAPRQNALLLPSDSLSRGRRNGALGASIRLCMFWNCLAAIFSLGSSTASVILLEEPGWSTCPSWLSGSPWFVARDYAATPVYSPRRGPSLETPAPSVGLVRRPSSSSCEYRWHPTEGEGSSRELGLGEHGRSRGGRGPFESSRPAPAQTTPASPRNERRSSSFATELVPINVRLRSLPFFPSSAPRPPFPGPRTIEIY